MLEFLSRWFPGAALAHEQDKHQGGGGLLPFPVTEKGSQAKWKKHDLKPLDTSQTSLSISHPIPKSSPQSLTGFDDFSGQWLYAHPQVAPQGHSRAGPSNVAWLNENAGSFVGEHRTEALVTLPRIGPPAVIRLPSQSHLRPIRVGRSVSTPNPPTSHTTGPSSKWNLGLNTSTHSLRLDPNPSIYHMSTSSSTDLFGYAYNYPLAKQLSPIAEQDYLSPESLKRSIPLPGSSIGDDNDHCTSSDKEAGIEPSPSLSYSYSHTNPSPGGSQTSEITRMCFFLFILLAFHFPS